MKLSQVIEGHLCACTPRIEAMRFLLAVAMLLRHHYDYRLQCCIHVRAAEGRTRHLRWNAPCAMGSDTVVTVRILSGSSALSGFHGECTHWTWLRVAIKALFDEVAAQILCDQDSPRAGEEPLPYLGSLVQRFEKKKKHAWSMQ